MTPGAVEIARRDTAPALTMLSRLTHSALATRREYLALLETLRSIQAVHAIAHYQGRLRRSVLPVPLGEFVPSLLKPLFLSPCSIDKSLDLAWFFLYHHSLLTDDIEDGHVQPSGTLAATNAFLLDQATARWHALASTGTDVLAPLFDRYYREQMEAGRDVVGSPRSIGKRGALVKFFVAILAWVAENRTPTPSEEYGIERLLAGFQILDDAADHDEDRHAQSTSAPQSTESNRNAGMRAVAHFQSGLDHLSVQPTSALALFVGDFQQRTAAAIRAVDWPRSAHERTKRQPVFLPLAAN